MATSLSQVPEGFEPLFRTSPFLDLIGPLYAKKSDTGLVIGFYAESKHCNARELVHGGMLSTVADVALGYNSAFNASEPVPMVTSSLTIDYVDAARLGDWIRVETDVQKVGRRVAYANCYFYVNDKRIARASAVFTVLS